MEHYKQHYYSGNYYRRHYRSGLDPYEKFVANKNVEGKQSTTIWYLDVLIKSHISNAKKLNDKFGKKFHS